MKSGRCLTLSANTFIIKYEKVFVIILIRNSDTTRHGTEKDNTDGRPHTVGRVCPEIRPTQRRHPLWRGVEPNPEVPFAKFTALVFHPDLLNRTALGRQMSRYEFFGYSSNEALHLSATEVEVFRGVLAMIEQELHRAIDQHTRELIVSNIELLLNYCLRFYDRQFITREEINHSVVKKFVELLDKYISSKALRDGLPTVAYFADKCCLSSGYFGNLVRVETGRTAKDIISDHLLAHAKQLLNDEALTITIISRRLGFEYPQHFVRFFKSHTGKTPSAFRNEV